MKNKTHICFVCSDNIGRSLIAEYALKEYAKKHNLDIESSSAGTDTTTDTTKFCFAHFDELNKIGIDVSKHKRTQLTQKVMDEMDLVVAMAEYHQEWIKEKYNVDVPMFSEIINGKKISFEVPSPDKPECEIVLRGMVHEIFDAMPIFVKNMRKYFLQIPS